MPFNDLDLSYIAGFFDGEGSIHFNVKKDRKVPYVRPVVTITQTDKSILLWINKTLGFGSKLIYHKQEVKDSYKPAYHIHFGDRQAERIILILYRYIRLKREQADLILEFYKIKDRNYSQRKIEIAKRCHELNMKGGD